MKHSIQLFHEPLLIFGKQTIIQQNNLHSLFII